MSERVALVTGAAGGLGRALATAFATDGLCCALTDLPATVPPDAPDLPGAPSVRWYAANLAEPSACTDLVAAVLADHGRIDVLVNNAAAWIARDLDELTAEDFDRMAAVNLRAPFLLAQAVLPGMRTRGWGRIVNVASIAARDGGGAPTTIAYAATKGGLLSLTRSLARHASGDGVLVNAIVPSAIRTPMIGVDDPDAPHGPMPSVPLGRSAHPAEVAEVVRWLASDACTYVHGAALDVNGGRHLS
jgi:NAD(P)-dependent dehydrogenase (short-subunit alcohol dehydrogenase family)